MLATSWTFNIRTVQQFYIHAVLSRFQSCLTLCNPMDCSLPSSSIHGTLQASIQEWVAMPSSRGSSQTMDWICISYISCSLPLMPPGKPFIFISSVQFSSVTQSCLTLCNHMNRSTPGLPVHHQLPEFYSNSCPSSQWCHLILCHPLLLLPTIPPSIRVFSNETTLCMR